MNLLHSVFLFIIILAVYAAATIEFHSDIDSKQERVYVPTNVKYCVNGRAYTQNVSGFVWIDSKQTCL